MTRIEAVDDDLMIASDFEAPGLSVVTARRPARQIENLLADSHIDSTAPVDKTYNGRHFGGRYSN
jgi:hypothetical protein